MVDLHAHILMGADDGSQSLEESLRMARIASDSGVRAMVMTPHFNIPGQDEDDGSERLKLRFTLLREAVKAARIPLRLYPGMEVFGRENLPLLMQQKLLIPINDGSYLLVEFDFEEEAEWMTFWLEQILKEGYIPLVAHPERYACIQENPNLAYQWILMGCALQVNKGSILGRFGRREQQTAMLLIEHELAACVASDAHHADYRTPHMGEAAAYLKEMFGTGCVQLLMKDNPARVLNSQKIVLPEPRGFRRKWF